MVEAGVHLFRRIQTAKEQKSHAVHTTHWATLLIKQTVEPIADEINRWMERAHRKPGRRHAALMNLEEVDPLTAAWAGMRKCVESVVRKSSLQSTARTIGASLRDELTVAGLAESSEGLYAKTNKSVDESPYRSVSSRRLDALKKVALDKTPESVCRWSHDDCLAVGLVIIECILASSGMFFLARGGGAEADNPKGYKSRGMYTLQPTQALTDFIVAATSTAEILRPSYLPMRVPPVDWTNPEDGGYLTLRYPLVKRKGRRYLRALAAQSMPAVYASINAHQRSPWRIHDTILEVVEWAHTTGQEVEGVPPRDNIPLPPKPTQGAPDAEWGEYKKRGRAVFIRNMELTSHRYGFFRILHTAQSHAQLDRFYFPYDLDYRGRIYPKPAGLNPQGGDLCKGLLRPAVGKPLGLDGARWLAIHAANTWGNDKIDIHERVRWTEENTQDILRYAENPYDNKGWMKADKPWQFLATCFEWAGYTAQGPSFCCSLRVSVDGTCSGIQHFAAMSRDEVSGMLVNLTPAPKQYDIYRQVADGLNDLLVSLQDSPEWYTPKKRPGRGPPVPESVAVMAKAWVDSGPLTRDHVKRPVMVLPYSATYTAFREYLHEALRARFKDPLDPADIRPDWPGGKRTTLYVAWLTQRLCEVMTKVVRGPIATMAWLKASSAHGTRAGAPITWVTPSGFLVSQVYHNTKRRRIRSKLGENLVYISYRERVDGLDAGRSRLGISPNFVHSHDAAALHLATSKRPWDFISTTHDDFGTLPTDMSALMHDTLDSIAWMYENHDVLGDIHQTFIRLAKPEDVKHIAPPPPTGSLNISDIRKSVYALN